MPNSLLSPLASDKNKNTVHTPFTDAFFAKISNFGVFRPFLYKTKSVRLKSKDCIFLSEASGDGRELGIFVFEVKLIRKH